MDNKNKRPVYLNLLRIRLPIGAVVSILHRVTGVVLVLLMPAALYLLDLLTRDPQAFAAAAHWLRTTPGRLVVLASIWLLAQHFFSGIRHLLLDIDIGAARAAARASAWTTLAASALTLIAAAAMLR